VSKKPKPETVITDDAIEAIVSFIESATVYAETLNMTVPEAARMMFKVGQTVQRRRAQPDATLKVLDLFKSASERTH